MSDFELPEKPEGKEERKTGLIIAIIAVVLAVCAALGNKSDNDEILARVEASNSWAYFQAKRQRDFMMELSRQQLEIQRLSANPEQTRKIDEAMTRYQEKGVEYKNEQAEIKGKAEASEKEAEKAGRQGNFLDIAEVVLQLAVVLCSISVITGQALFVRIGIGAAVVGTGISIAAFLT